MGVFTATATGAHVATAAPSRPSARVVVPAPITPDPALAVRASRAVTATLPPAADGSATGGTIRLTLNPVTGAICTTSTDLLAEATPSATATGLSLALPDGSRVGLTDSSFTGCVSATPSVATGALADPAAYSALLVSTTGEEAAAPLAPAAAVGRPWSVGTRTETILDGTRGTARRGRVPAQRSRTIRVTYYYPTQGTASGADAPINLEGPFPVVLFSPGYAVTPATYALTLRAWAAAGYLVAGVLSPGSGGGLPGTPTEADLAAQPRDLSVVVSTITRHAADPASWLGGSADLARVAVTGHSDGGTTAAAAGLLQRFTDPRYGAVIVMSGASLGGAKARHGLPLLVLSGARDEYNSQSTFLHVFNLGRTTKTWVQAINARHLPPFVVANQQAEDLRALEIAFLDRSLFGAGTRAAERSLATERGLTRIAAGSF